MSVNVRQEVQKLSSLGPLPDEKDDSEVADSFYEDFEQLLEDIEKPISLEEAKLLVRLFPPVSCYGLDWSILHLIESTPSWPIAEVIDLCSSAEWKQRLSQRSKNK